MTAAAVCVTIVLNNTQLLHVTGLQHFKRSVWDLCAHAVQTRWWGEVYPQARNSSWICHKSQTPTDTKLTLCCELSEQHRRREGRKLTVRGRALNYTELPFKTGKLHQTLVDGCSPHAHPVPYPQPTSIISQPLCVCVCVLCAPVCFHKVYLVTLLTCILSCKRYLRKASKKELLIIQQRGVM